MNIRVLLFWLGITASAPLTQAADQDSAGTLHQEHCIACHGTDVYTREDRKVTSLPGLHGQVQRCELALGLKWFDEEISGVTSYLNEQYYHFKP